MTEGWNEPAAAAALSTEQSKLSKPVEPAALALGFRSLTPARIGLQRAGASIATNELLAFQSAHARARDAVHAELQTAALMQALRAIPAVNSLPEPGVLLLHSLARDRHSYLQRPDLGRKLDPESLARLEAVSHPGKLFTLSIVIADGLSALAVERNSAALLTELFPLLQGSVPSLALAPICVVEQGRVAVGDEVARALCAELVIVLIGERPGLSSPDSLGVYITWLKSDDAKGNSDVPRRTGAGITDADRNCISNIRSEGLSHADAAMRILHYIVEARVNRQTGIALKDPPPAYRCPELTGDDNTQQRAALPITKEPNDA